MNIRLQRLLCLCVLFFAALPLSAQLSTKGTEFWLGFMNNQTQPNPRISIFLTADVPSIVTIRVPQSTFSRTVQLSANQTQEVILPLEQVYSVASEIVQNMGIQITSTTPISVYALNFLPATSDATVVYPKNSLGTNYLVTGAYAEGDRATQSEAQSEFLIVATEENTQVQITPSVPTASGRNTEFSVTLNRGQTYQVISVRRSLSLTGTSIRSNKPIAVFSGSVCTFVGGCPACNHLFEQISPTQTWGKRFITTPLLATRAGMPVPAPRQDDFFQITASENATEIIINGVRERTMNARETYSFSANTPQFIQANNPIAVVQYSKGSNCDMTLSDPFSLIVPPLEQVIDKITFNAFSSTVINQYFTNVVTLTRNVPNVTLDGQVLSGFQPIPGTEYSFARRQITQGNHTLDAGRTEDGLIAIVYGYGDFDSYGYLSGINAEVQCTITNPPPSASESHLAAQFLVRQRVIDCPQNGDVRPNDRITRAEIAKVAFLGAKIPSFAGAFPVPFLDLQDSNATTEFYYAPARNLCYLEYGDGVSPFRRDFLNFNPSATITRAAALKVLLETWNVRIDVGDVQETGFSDPATGPFAGKPLYTHPLYRYIYSAVQQGIIRKPQFTSESDFRPDEPATRAEVFAMIHRLMDSKANVQGIAILQPTPSLNDFFIPGNFRLQRLTSIPGMEEGNFNHYTKTSFSIPGIKLPLLFEHTYNSFLTEMPDSLFAQKPLGEGWSHTYNSFIVPAAASATPTDTLAWVQPSGAMHLYAREGAGYRSLTQGVYDVLTLAGDRITIRTKSQMQFVFERAPSSASRAFLWSSLTEPNGNALTIEYETGVSNERRVSRVNVAGGRALAFEYEDGSNLLTSVSDPLGRKVRFGYSRQSFPGVPEFAVPTSFINAKNDITTYNYGITAETSSLLISMNLPRGNRVTNTYEKRKLRAMQTVSDNSGGGIPSRTQIQPTRFTTDAPTARATITDPKGNTMSVDFNRANGKPASMELPEAMQMSVEYADTRPQNRHLPTRYTASNGMIFRYEYDERGNMTKTTTEGSTADNTSFSETFTFDDRNNLLTYTDPRGKISRYEYDSRNNLTASVTPLQERSTMTYLSNGLLERAQNPEGIATAYQYSPQGDLLTATAPLNLVQRAEYDAAGRITASINAAGQRTQYQYDANDNVLSMQDAIGNTTRYEYDENDLLKSVTPAKPGVARTSLLYDNRDFLVAKTFGGFNTTYKYFADGTLESSTNPNRVTRTLEYDALGRLTKDNQRGEFDYYGRGQHQLRSMRNTNGQETRFEYDRLNRITRVTDPFGNVVNYAYDVAGNLISLIYPGGKTVSYAYDDNNRLASVTDWLGQQTRYAYRRDGLLREIRLPNGIVTAFDYDEAGRMRQQRTTRTQTGEVLTNYEFALDNNGNILRETAQGQALQALQPVQPPTGSLASTFDAVNRLRSQGAETFQYDRNGNTLSRSGAATGTPPMQFTFDANDDLTGVSGALNATYRYDAAGNRIAATRNGTTTLYVLDIRGSMSNILMETTDNGTPLHYYVHGLGMIARIKADNQTRYYHYDYRGSTVAMTDPQGATTHRYAYTDFGVVTEAQEQDFNPFRYVGQHGVMWEANDLTFMRARYYAPSTGRFLSEDPVWSTNLYPYAGNNAVNGIDPQGTTVIRNWYRFSGPIRKVAEEGISGALDVKSAQEVGDAILQAGNNFDFNNGKKVFCKSAAFGVGFATSNISGGFASAAAAGAAGSTGVGSLGAPAAAIGAYGVTSYVVDGVTQQLVEPNCHLIIDAGVMSANMATHFVKSSYDLSIQTANTAMKIGNGVISFGSSVGSSTINLINDVFSRKQPIQNLPPQMTGAGSTNPLR